MISTRRVVQRCSARGPGRPGRRAMRNVAVVVLGAGLVLPPALSAGAATEADIFPVNGVFELQGLGYGHGRGMSQWGAQGAATLGIQYAEILAFYYPGTSLAPGDDTAPIRVHITDDKDGDLRVRPAPGLRVAGGTRSRLLPTKVGGQPVSIWRVKLSSGKLRLTARANKTWTTVKVAGKSTLASPVQFRTEPSNGVRIIISSSEERDYRGQALAYADASTGGALRVVNQVTMQDYLRSVVPSEAITSWAPAALEAQSVAARTYALWRTQNLPLGFADICDTTSCQVYHGARRTDGKGVPTRVWEAASTDRAVLRTAGRVLRYGGAPALTEFCAANGGYSTDGSKPYLVAKTDPWDGVVASSAHTWNNRLKASTITKKYPEIGTVVKIRVLERDGNGPWGGRVLRVKLYGTTKTLTVNGFAFAKAVGLRHSWWRPTGSGSVTTVAPISTADPAKDRSAPAPAPAPPVGPGPGTPGPRRVS